MYLQFHLCVFINKYILRAAMVTDEYFQRKKTLTIDKNNNKLSEYGTGVSPLILLLPSFRDIVLISGIYVFFLAFGYFQESVFQVTNIHTGEKFSYPVFLVALLCGGNVIVSGLILFIEFSTSLHGAKLPPTTVDDIGIVHKLRSPTCSTANSGTNIHSKGFWYKHVFNMESYVLKQICLSSITYILSMLCTNYALNHVNYPTQVLIKSAKSVPVILGGAIFFRKRYPMHDYYSVLAITGSLVLFNLSRGANGSNKPHHQTILGIILLFLSLLCDSLTGPRQDQLLSRVKVSSTHLMFLTNIFASLLGITCCLFVEGFGPIIFCFKTPSVISKLVLFCLSAGFGQVFIFGALTAFGSLHLALITTTRKFFTVMLSVILFGHNVSFLQWICVSTVFISLGVQSYCTKKLKRNALQATLKPAVKKSA